MLIGSAEAGAGWWLLIGCVETNAGARLSIGCAETKEMGCISLPTANQYARASSTHILCLACENYELTQLQYSTFSRTLVAQSLRSIIKHRLSLWCSALAVFHKTSMSL